MKNVLDLVWPPLLTLALVVAFAEGIVRSGAVPEYLVPMPSSVIMVFIEDRVELVQGLAETATAAGLGLFLSFVFGSSVAGALSVSKFLRKAFMPYAVFFQTVPVIAIAPLLVIWFGFGQPTVIASAFIVSIFPVIASTLLGLQSTDPALDELFRLYSASSRDRFFKLRLPFALPQIFSGLKIAAGLAVIGAVVGEFIGGGGLGAVVDVARTQQRTDKVFAAVLLSSFLGLVLVGVIGFLNWILLRRWHASAQPR